MTASRYPKNKLTEMFEKACLNNNGFGDPDPRNRSKTNIPVHIRPSKQAGFSYAFIEAGPGVFDPLKLSSDQLVIGMSMLSDSKARLQFTGDHFDAEQCRTIVKALAEDPAIRLVEFDTESQTYILQVDPFDQQIIDKIVRAWRKAIEPSLRDLGYEI